VLQIQRQSDEYNLLIEHYKAAQSRLIRERAHCIVLSMQGRHAPDIAGILLRDEDTIREWLKTYQEKRLASIFPHYQDNANASKLTREQLAEVKATLQASPDSAGGLPGSFWSVKKLKAYLQAEYGVVYESSRSYHHLFTVSNFSFKLPEGFDQRRNDELVATRMAEITQEVVRKQSEGYTVFFADECSLAWETEYRRVWLPKGKKTVLRVNRKKTRQHYFGALNLTTKQEEVVRLDWQNTENITDALRELTKRYPGQKLCLVWDNARWHRSKDLRALLGKGNEFEHIHFIWLPPYAPDYNPQEHVWRVAKTETKNTVTKTFEELKRVFETTISGKTFDYKMSEI
jgi:transposase